MMLTTLFLLAYGLPLQDSEEIELVSDGDFATPLTADWFTTNLKVTYGTPPKSHIKKYLEMQTDAKDSDGTLQVKNSGMVHLGETVYLRVWARSSELKSDPDHLHVRLHALDSDEGEIFDRTVTLSSQWKEYKFAATVKGYYLPGALSLSVLLHAGTSIQLANLRLLDMGETSPTTLSQSEDKKPKTSKGKTKSQ